MIYTSLNQSLTLKNFHVLGNRKQFENPFENCLGFRVLPHCLTLSRASRSLKQVSKTILFLFGFFRSIAISINVNEKLFLEKKYFFSFDSFRSTSTSPKEEKVRLPHSKLHSFSDCTPLVLQNTEVSLSPLAIASERKDFVSQSIPPFVTLHVSYL